MNRKQKLLQEIEAILKPRVKDEYFMQHIETGLFYRADDYDLSICQPRPGAEGKRLTINGSQIYQIGGCRVHF